MASASTWYSQRLQTCLELRNNEIACVVWFEDAIAYYGVPTALFDFYILVSDLHLATQILEGKGWVLTSQPAEIGNALKDRVMHTLIPPRAEQDLGLPNQAMTILLPATEWKYQLSDQVYLSSDPASFFPPLPKLVDALLASLLDELSDYSMFHSHVACQISYLYGYASALKEPDFAWLLTPDHRQYHFDTLSGMETNTVKGLRHQRKIREAIRQGSYKLQECSASRDNEDFFTEKRRMRILASLPPPVS